MQRKQYIFTFGDAWDLRSLIGSPPLGPELCGRRLSVGAFRVRSGERFGDFRELRLRARAEIMEHIVDQVPDVLVLVLDAVDRLRVAKAESLARGLAMDAAHTSAMLTGLDLSVVPLVIHVAWERDVLVSALLGGRFHRVFADGSVPIEVAQLERAPPQVLISEGEL
ncbi:hypothetical protein JD276_12510 [Leucobacter sp. CSA1]|uniref:Uncharacterized protein n=1 Tax=Leucobacter chromiisoli TaxID=2796471 RepID=A0A934QB49_9MICO|nr:hypothetical protein [Leucobacter chromiisoli]MBK0419857.1 hypothetical protein [Leucobacter chromiisoli]